MSTKQEFINQEYINIKKELARIEDKQERLLMLQNDEPEVALITDWADNSVSRIFKVGDSIVTKYGNSGIITSFERNEEGVIVTFTDGEMERTESIHRISV